MLTVHAPAKINLSLRVRGRRADGFHEIETVMCPLALADEIELEAASPDAGAGIGTPGVRFQCDDPTLPVDASNLAVRAATLFLDRAGLAGRAGTQLALRKRIPHGAGLGGGSSDAASVLLGLNEIFRTGFDVPTLARLSTELGSDVAFFIYRAAAICRGRGEIVEPLPDFAPGLRLLLLKPAFGVPTPWAYKHWQESREIPGAHYAPQPFAWGELVNDLERPVFEKYVFLAALKSWLLAQPEVAGALLSGSGSTVLAFLRDNQAEAAGNATLEARVQAQFGAELWSCRTRTIQGRDAREARPYLG